MGGFLNVIHRDLTLALRRRSDIVNPAVFFIIVVTLFPLGVGPELQMLGRIGPGIIWVAALLAAMLSLENLFHGDFDDGSLEQLLTSPQAGVVVVFAKITAHWITSGLPIVILSPLLAVLLHVDGEAVGVLVLSLLLGTPVLSLVGAIGVALTVSQRRGGVLLSMLVLPLYIPVLILGAGAVDLAAGGLSPRAHLLLLGALLVLALTLAPWGAAAAVRTSVEGS